LLAKKKIDDKISSINNNVVLAMEVKEVQEEIMIKADLVLDQMDLDLVVAAVVEAAIVLVVYLHHAKVYEEEEAVDHEMIMEEEGDVEADVDVVHMVIIAVVVLLHLRQSVDVLHRQLNHLLLPCKEIQSVV
jgi:hypothetical protein